MNDMLQHVHLEAESIRKDLLKIKSVV